MKKRLSVLLSVTLAVLLNVALFTPNVYATDPVTPATQTTETAETAEESKTGETTETPEATDEKESDETTEATPELIPSISYSSHIQNIGDKQGARKDGQLAGTTGQSKRAEGISVKLDGAGKSHVCYRVHVQNVGWQTEVSDGKYTGTKK